MKKGKKRDEQPSQKNSRKVGKLTINKKRKKSLEKGAGKKLTFELANSALSKGSCAARRRRKKKIVSQKHVTVRTKKWNQEMERSTGFSTKPASEQDHKQ